MVDSTANDQFTVDLSECTPKFLRPELLTHPNIPKPVHGVNPRTLKGKAWWDETRREAYARNNGCCWACGTWGRLEAHESYDIFYYAGIIVLREVVALCEDCHSFIHSGRLRMLWLDGIVEKSKVLYILESRMEMLKRAGLRPFYGTQALLYSIRDGMEYYSALMQVDLEMRTHVAYIPPIPRHLWVLVVQNEMYDWKGRINVKNSGQ